MNSPIDSLRDIQKEEAYRQKREQDIKDEAIKNRLEAELLQSYINDNSNPNPIIITVIVVLVLLCIYILYKLYISPCLSGIWINDDNSITLDISHNVLLNRLYINNKQVVLSNNIIIQGDDLFLWDYKDNLLVWNKNMSFKRLIDSY